MLSHLKTIGLTVLLPFLVPAITPARTAIADARAATDVEIVGVKIGLGGAFRTGKWTPMTVQLKSESDASGTLQVITLDGDGMQAAFRPDASRVEIRAGQTASVPLLIRVAAVQPWLEVRFVADNGDVTDWQPNTDELGRGTLSSQQVLLQLGKPIGLADALAVRRRVAHEAMTVAKVEEAAQMPTQWLGYDACDVISLSTSDLTFLNRVTDEQRAALRDWVRRGGCLIFCVGSQGEAVLGAEGQWKDFAPGQFQRVTTMRNPGRIESFAGENYPITLNVDSNTGFPLPLSASVLADASGNILAYEGNDPLNQPLVVHATEGLGQILYVAVDLDASPLDDWNGRRHFVANLLDLGLGREGGDSSSGTKGQVTHLGYRDLGGQLRAALDRYPNVRPIPFSLVLAIAFIYLLLIGPADYFLLDKFFHRMHWTWISFPLIVFLTCIGISTLASRWKGHVTHVNQADLVDVDVAGGTIVGRNWTSIFVPTNRRLNVKLIASPDVIPDGGQLPDRQPGNALTWLALPGTGYGGIDNESSLIADDAIYQVVNEGSLQSPSYQLHDLPLQDWSSRGFYGIWWAQSSNLECGELQEVDRLVAGSVVNPLPVPLNNCQLMFGRWYYALGDLAPGESRLVDSSLTAKNIAVQLTRKKVVETGKSSTQVSTPWDQQNMDVPRIMEMMMFHNAAGGRGYTSLLHRQYRALDMSSQLELDHAILVGRVATPAASVVDSSEELQPDPQRHWTVVRLLLPINHPRGSGD